MRGLWRSFVPFLVWWPEITTDTLRRDLIAASIGAIACVPQGVAFATIAGLPPQYGLYAAMVPAIMAALFGSSRQLVSGPATPISIMLFGTLSVIAEPGSLDYVRYAVTLAFLVGIVQLAMGLARLGELVTFLSHSVIVGFSSGAGLLIAASQIDSFFGIELPRGLHFFETLFMTLNKLAETNLDSLFVGATTIVTGLAVKRYRPRFPYMIAALLAGSLLAAALEVLTYAGWLHADTGMTGIGRFEPVPANLPPLSYPDLSFATIKELAPATFAVTLFALAQAVSIARSLATRTGDLIDGSQEFIGQGLANIAGSFFSSYVCTGSLNRSAVNADAGACTPLAAAFSGVMLMALVVVVAPLLTYMPTSAMAGVLFIISWGLVDVAHMRSIVRSSRADSMVLWTTFFATLLLSLDFAIVLGVMLSLFNYLRSASRPSVMVRVPDPSKPLRRFSTDANLPECPQLAMVRIDGAVFFGSAGSVAGRLRRIARRQPAQKHLLILARSVSYLDFAGAEMIRSEHQARAAVGGKLYLHHLQAGPLAMLQRDGVIAEIGEDNIFQSKGEAISAIFDRLDRDICLRCDKRIFNECRALPRLDGNPPPEALAAPSG